MSKNRIKNLQDLKNKKTPKMIDETVITSDTQSQPNTNSNIETENSNVHSDINSSDIESNTNQNSYQLSLEIENLKVQLSSKEAESKDWQTKAYRYVADLDNSRKQQELENAQLKKNTKKYLAKPIVDFLNHQFLALSFTKDIEDEKAKKTLATLHISFDKLIQDLKLQNIEVIVPSIGDKFDPEFMQSLNEHEDQESEALVKNVVSIGLRIDGQVIQPCMIMF
jgi:molecular chaperone GrpE (heat shock protein)